MNNEEPIYITKLKKDLISHFDDKIEKEVGSLAAMTADQFRLIDSRFEEMATKEDLVNFVTKDDIKNMAIKDDIKNMATKDDIKNMATKDDIKNMATKDDIEEIKNEMLTKEEYKEGQKLILAHIGRYEIRAQNIEEILLQDHKPRIADLENEVFK
jgi:hypothetical protein